MIQCTVKTLWLSNALSFSVLLIYVQSEQKFKHGSSFGEKRAFRFSTFSKRRAEQHPSQFEKMTPFSKYVLFSIENILRHFTCALRPPFRMSPIYDDSVLLTDFLDCRVPKLTYLPSSSVLKNRTNSWKSVISAEKRPVLKTVTILKLCHFRVRGSLGDFGKSTFTKCGPMKGDWTRLWNTWKYLKREVALLVCTYHLYNESFRLLSL